MRTKRLKNNEIWQMCLRIQFGINIRVLAPQFLEKVKIVEP